MFPVYGGVTSNPYQVPPSQHYYPSWQAMPPQRTEDATSPSFMYGTLPPHNYAYPVSMPCHNCCSHHGQHPPCYNFTPSYSHFPSPQAFNQFYGGGYPPYPQPHPVNYTPPPNYIMEIPRYEFDKNVPHCCGCPNHSCNAKEGTNVKIEEHEPDVETKKSVDNFPYPILWIPPGYSMNKEQPKRLVGDKEDERKMVSPSVNKPQQWIPLDVKQMAESGDGRKTVDQENKNGHGKKTLDLQNKDQDRHFPYPVIWMPYGGLKEDDRSGQEETYPGRKIVDQENKNGHGKKTCDLENKDQDKNFPYPVIWMPYGGLKEDDKSCQEERNPTFKVVPLKFEHPHKEDEKTKTEVEDKGVGDRVAEKTSNVKTIPVKQLEDSIPKLSKKDEEIRDATKVNQESCKNGNNMQSSSPTKKSKLPPICLRVDPPRKKNGNGSSRSPSPPGKKERQVMEAMKTPIQNKTEDKVAAVESKAVQEVKPCDAKSGEDDRVQAQESEGVKESKPHEVRIPERKILSGMEAATIIQSAYRGYQVRRWEPLKKLRQIAEVRDEATKVKKQIEDLEAKSSIANTEKTAIGETIMKLLLKLDTIQGLHPSIRDIRRSVAKDLIVLQEKFDSLVSQKSTPTAQETSTLETVMEPSEVSNLDEGSEGEDKNECTLEVATKASEVSTLDECSEGEGKSTKSYEENVGPTLNELVASERLSSQGVVCGSENMDEVSTFDECSEGEGKSTKSCEENVRPTLNELAVSEPLSGQDVVCRSENMNLHDESREVEGKSAKSCEENVGPTLNEQAASEPLSSQVDVCGSENMDSHDEAQGVAVSLPESVSEPQMVDFEKPLMETQESLAELEPVRVDMAGQLDMASGDEDQEANLLTELPREVLEEDEKEIPHTDVNYGIAYSDTKLPQVMIEDAEEPTPEISSPEPLNIDRAMVQLTKNPVLTSNPEESTTESPTAKECESIVGVKDVDIPILEEMEHELQDPNPSVIASSDLEKTREEFESQGDEQMPPVDDNTNDHSIATEDSQYDAQQYEDIHEARKESMEGKGLQAEKKIVEENEKLKEMLEKLIVAGKEQQNVISNLSGKVKDLEKKLMRKKKIARSTKRPRVIVSRPLCERPMGVAS